MFLCTMAGFRVVLVEIILDFKTKTLTFVRDFFRAGIKLNKFGKALKVRTNWIEAPPDVLNK